jgi:hypothetical protein
VTRVEDDDHHVKGHEVEDRADRSEHSHEAADERDVPRRWPSEDFGVHAVAGDRQLPHVIKQIIEQDLRRQHREVGQEQRCAGGAEHVPEVHNVSNMITIKPHLPKAADVADRVSEAIERMADLDARSVWVTTSNGSVRLHGHVHSLAERRNAGFAAASAPGVQDVENQILVTP